MSSSRCPRPTGARPPSPPAGGRSAFPTCRATPSRDRRFPWGSEAPGGDPPRANLDGDHLSCVDVAALPAGDSAAGCRQMMGNAWEWTASTFEPYPGFTPDPYAEYSGPWFGTRTVLRGGAPQDSPAHP